MLAYPNRLRLFGEVCDAKKEMAFYRVSLGVVARSGGGSSKRRSAYMRGAEFDGHDFTSKADEIFDQGMILPEHADQKYYDPEVLWTEVEQTETRVNSVFARTLEIAIPVEIPEELHATFAKDLLQFIADEHGLAVEWAIHQEWSAELGRHTSHIHSAETTRGFDDAGLMTKRVNKDREFKTLCSKSAATNGKIPIRSIMADKMNSWMAQHKIDATVSAEAKVDRDLVMPDMPYAVRKAHQRWQAETQAANLAGTKPPDLPRYVERYIGEIDAIRELKAAEAALETALKAEAATSDTKENNDGERDKDERGAGTSSRADRGHNRSDQRLVGGERDGRRVSTGASDGADRRLPGIDRRKDRQDRRSTEHIRRAARGKLSRTIAQRIRNDDAAAKHLDRLSALNTAKQKTSVTTLLQRIVRNDVAARFIKRLEALTEKIKNRRESTNAAKTIEIRAIAERSDQGREVGGSTPAPKSRFPRDGSGYSAAPRAEHTPAIGNNRKSGPPAPGQQQDRSSAAPVDRQALKQLARAATQLKPLSDDLRAMPVHHGAPVSYGGAEALPDPSDPFILQKISQINARQMSNRM